MFRSHGGDVSSYLARMLRDPDLAEDLTQDAFLRCCATLQGGGRPENLRDYLYRIARTIAIDHLRLHRRHPQAGRPCPGRHRRPAAGAGAPDDRPRAAEGLPARAGGSARQDVADLRAAPHPGPLLPRGGAAYGAVGKFDAKHLARALFEVTRRLREYEDGR
ncbi:MULTISPECIES: sigma-70 family RNA polymerase sigma factor [Paracoccus]|uniref:RNA polymerase sigma factor n=1 Tax=Paracoccus sp. AS002 TaxID=3019545 RepID=UPI001FB719AE|nr:sigma-70 family RNA polymerase sigma factor [Paracoccus sp. AS002]MCJ1899488.1 sigma-70 family RNA polymerase sigma factor [Paracoccus versutus]MDF3904787.1 sigma-70 family RNA polymerase sigma factor [Paracoccus sp. AS002]